jgi:hypothetical protein
LAGGASLRPRSSHNRPHPVPDNTTRPIHLMLICFAFDLEFDFDPESAALFAPFAKGAGFDVAFRPTSGLFS